MAEKMDAKLDYNQKKEEVVVDANRKLRIGIIGCGWFADSHIDSYKRMPDVEIVAGCDLIPGKAAAFFKKNGVEGVKTDYASHKEMLDDESLKLDAVSSVRTTAHTQSPRSTRSRRVFTFFLKSPSPLRSTRLSR